MSDWDSIAAGADRVGCGRRRRTCNRTGRRDGNRPDADPDHPLWKKLEQSAFAERVDRPPGFRQPDPGKGTLRDAGTLLSRRRLFPGNHRNRAAESPPFPGGADRSRRGGDGTSGILRPPPRRRVCRETDHHRRTHSDTARNRRRRNAVRTGRRPGGATRNPGGHRLFPGAGRRDAAGPPPGRPLLHRRRQHHLRSADSFHPGKGEYFIRPLRIRSGTAPGDLLVPGPAAGLGGAGTLPART